MKSIRRQLTLCMMGAVVLLYGLAAAFCHAGTMALLESQFDAALLDRARALCSLVVRDPGGGLEIMPVDSALSEFGRVRHPQYLQIWDSGGNTIQRSGSLGGGDLALPLSANDTGFWNAKLPNGLSGRGVWIRFTPGMEDEEGAPVTQPDVLRPALMAAPVLTLAVLRDRAPLARVERVMVSSLLLTFALLCVGTLAVVPFVVRRALGSLHRLSAHAARIDASSLSEPFPVDGVPDELKPICLRLNDLLRRLEAAFDRERRFNANVAHELRTPIAELRALAEVAIKWPGDERAAARVYQDTLAIAAQMEGVVTTLLALARLESDRLEAKFERVDLCAAIRDAWRPLAAAAEARDLAVRFELPEHATLRADHAVVGAIVANLLSNAVEYCPRGGAVECAVRSRREGAELCVSNTNDSLTPDDLGSILEPFWRKDSSRSDWSHSGLGLPLVAAYAKVLGADLAVELTEDAHFCATVRFPTFAGRPGASVPRLEATRT
jgi:two-component system sensor histidine kinase QseC